MKKANIGKRLFTLLLALVMALGIAPAIDMPDAYAAEEDPVVVIAGSDFQSYKEVNGSNVTDHAAGAAQVKGLLNAIKKDGHPKADGFLFVGDYDYGVGDSANGKKQLQAAVQSIYGKNMDEVYTQGNHDADNLVSNGTLAPSGENDTDNYGVFVINEMDYDWGGVDREATEDIAYDLDKYLNAKVAEDYKKPIFVLCHIPLHYTMRTYKADEGDARYAYMIFDELNEAGADGLNIIFLFGHNHSGGWDDYLGGSAIYLTKGDKINICQGNQQKWKVETLNFTYMNAGYVSYYRNVNTGSECDLTMTVFAIYENEVVIKRYSKDGVHDLKSKGVRNNYAATHFGPYWGTVETYSPNTKIYASPQVISLAKKADTSALEAVITKAEAVKEADYTQESYTTLKDALKAAKAVLAKSSPTQDEVDAAVKTLNDAISALEEYKSPVNTKALESAIADAEAVDSDDYTEDSYAALEKALTDAKNVLANTGATQAQVDAAATALKNAQKALVKAEKPTDPTEKPTDPTEKPTDPVDPTEGPTDPTEKPTDPTEKPTDPTDPTEPAVKPTDAPTEAPTDAPENPTVAPTEAPAADKDADEAPKGNAGLIIGIIAAVVVVAAVVFFIIKKKK